MLKNASREQTRFKIKHKRPKKTLWAYVTGINLQWAIILSFLGPKAVDASVSLFQNTVYHQWQLPDKKEGLKDILFKHLLELRTGHRNLVFECFNSTKSPKEALQQLLNLQDGFLKTTFTVDNIIGDKFNQEGVKRFIKGWDSVTNEKLCTEKDWEKVDDYYLQWSIELNKVYNQNVEPPFLYTLKDYVD